MKTEIQKSAKRMLTRANELGFVTKSGAPLAIDHMEELLAADQGYRNVHAFKAALAQREAPALVQENPDEAGNDYRLVSGKGVWVKLGAFNVHPYLTAEGIIVDVYAGGAETDCVATACATDDDVLDVLTEHNDIDTRDLANWVQDSANKVFAELTTADRVTFVNKYLKARKPLVKKVYCIAMDGDAETGVNWYATSAARDAAYGTTGAEEETWFDLTVPLTASPEDITKLADKAAWDKDYTPL